MIIEILAVIGLIVLYVIWLFSPIIMFVCAENNDDTLSGLACIVYVVGAVVVGYVLVKFIGIW